MEDKRVTFFDCGISHITLNGWRYQLDATKPVGRGGTCLVYHALREEEGNPRRVIIKELYPASLQGSSLRELNGFLELPDTKSLRKCQDRFTHSYEMFKQFFNIDELNNYMVQAQEKPRGYGTTYMIVDYSSGITLEDYIEQAPSLLDFFTHMKVLSTVLDRMHNQGMVHMDLKPSNILCFDDGFVKYCKLMDTDSFLKKDVVTEELSVSISEGYVAPEIYRIACLLRDPFGNGPQLEMESAYFSQVGEKADIFSFGAILFRYLFGILPDLPVDGKRIRKQIWQNRLDELLKELPVQLKEKGFASTPKTIRLIRELLQGMLTGTPGDRFSANQIEKLISTILPLLDQKEIRIVENFSPNPYPVIGREDKLEAIKKALYKQKTKSRIVILSGIGGVGKSTLARQFAGKHKDKYDVVVEIYASSAEEAIQRIEIRNWEPDSLANAEERIFQCKKQLAELCFQSRILLVVHNYDVSEDEHFSIWEELGCDILITSRHQWESDEIGIPVLQLRSKDLSLEQAKEIFAFFYVQKAKTDAHKEKLIDILTVEDDSLGELLVYINLLPLGIKFQAKHMSITSGDEILPSQALKELKEERLDKGAHEKFQHRNDCYVKNGNVYEHVKATLRKDLGRTLAGSHAAFLIMILVPSSYGIGKERFEAWTGMNAIHLEYLEEIGWLEFLPGQKDLLMKDPVPGVYMLPTMFQQVLCEEPYLQCSVNNCGKFLINCSSDVYNGLFSSRIAFYAQQDSLVKYMQQDSSQEYIYFLKCVYSLQRLIDVNWDKQLTKKALNTWHIGLNLCQTYYPDNFELSGPFYRFLSVGYHSIGEVEKALQYYNILYNNSGTQGNTKQNFSEMLNNIETLAAFYLEQGLAEKSIALLQEYLIQYCGKPSFSPARKALWNRWIGTGYRFLGDWNSAQQYLTEAYWESVCLFDSDVLDSVLAINIAYLELGRLYYEMGDYQGAKNNLQKSLLGHIEVFGEKHPNTCDVRIDLARICVVENNIQEALDHHKKILESCLDSSVSAERSIITLFDIALDYMAMSGYEAYAEEVMLIAFKTLNKNQNKVNITCFSDAIFVIKERYAMHFCEHQVRTGLGKLEELCFLCSRVFGKSQALGKEYRNLAEIFSQYGIRLKSSYYYQCAKLCEE